MSHQVHAVNLAAKSYGGWRKNTLHVCISHAVSKGTRQECPFKVMHTPRNKNLEIIIAEVENQLGAFKMLMKPQPSDLISLQGHQLERRQTITPGLEELQRLPGKLLIISEKSLCI